MARHNLGIDPACNLALWPQKSFRPRLAPTGMNQPQVSNNVNIPLSQILMLQNPCVGLPVGYPQIPHNHGIRFGYPSIPPAVPGMPVGYPPMPNQEPKKTMFIRTMDRLGMQLLNKEPKTENNESSESDVTKMHTDTPSTGDATVDSPVGTGAKHPKKAKREVQFPTFKTRRQELKQIKKPYYYYIPNILKTWHESDYLKHKDLFQNQVFNKEDEEKLEEITLDVSQLTKERSIALKPLNVMPLKESMKPIQRKDRWWIVTDTKVLLDDMRFIDKLIKTDPTCRMRLPYEVLHDLTAMMAKRNKAWMRIPARRVVQYLETAVDRDRAIIGQGVVDNEDLVDSPVATDAILNCCLQLGKFYYYVVVISDDEERQKRAASVDLPCFSLDRVKELVRTSFLDVNNASKLQITVSRTFAANLAVEACPEQREEDCVVVHGPW